PTLPLQPVAGHPAGSLQIECELAAEESMQLQTSEQQVSVGYGGLPASPITDRAGIGAGGFRPDPQRSSCVESSNSSASRTHGVNVEHGHAHGKSGDLSLTACSYLSIYQRNIRRCSSHVERDDPLETAVPCHGSSPNHSSRRP